MSSRLNEGHLKWHQRLLLELLWGSCWLFARMPYGFRYYFVMPQLVGLLRLIRYRRKVVMQNLERSFPEKSAEELCEIRRRYDWTLAEVIVDIISLAGISPEQGREVVKWPNAEEHIHSLYGRDWVAMASHFGCWEYDPLWCWVDSGRDFLAVYHPLHNPVFECFFRRLRNYDDSVKQIPMRDCVRYYLRQRSEGGRPMALGLISDQNPTIHRNNHWFTFLNQDSIFFDGGEKLALKFHLPVYFCHVRRLKWGRYEIWFEEIYDGESEVAPNTITERYAALLEEMIRRCPELWMWSHRRWKHKRPQPQNQEA